MGVVQILRDFSGWTSAHGIPHIGSAQNLFLRLFWTVVFLVSTGMFIFQMILLIQKFLAYDVTVQTQLKFEERHFPAVTVCNLNPYKANKIDEWAPEISSLMDNYKDAISKKLNGSDRWGFHKLSDPIAIQSRARDLLMFLASNSRKKSKEAINEITYEMEEFILNCAYNTKPCDMTEDFERTIDPIYGACYTFNNKLPPGKIYKSTRAGPLYGNNLQTALLICLLITFSIAFQVTVYVLGLRLLLKSNQSEYLRVTESGGVRVSVHGQQEEPFPDAFGYNAAAGFTTSFGIKFIRTTRLPAPYGNCTDTKDFGSYHYKGTYSVEGCFRSCFQEHIKRECGCYDPRFGSPNENYCKADNITCVSKFTSTQERGSSFNAITSCSCPQPCNESTYGVTVSTALWPSDEYKLVNLVSDMGGQLGLWLGISVITVVEVFSLLVLLCLYCMARRKEPNLDDDDMEYTDNTGEKKAQADPSPPPPYDDDDVSDFSAPPHPK